MMKIYNTVLIILLIILACVFGALEGYKYKLEQKTEQYIEECENSMDLSIKLQIYAREYSQLMKGMDELIRDFEAIGKELNNIESQLEEYKKKMKEAEYIVLWKRDIPLGLEYQSYLYEKCIEYKMDYNLALAKISLESNFNILARGYNKTNDGAIKSIDYGLMQVNSNNIEWANDLVGRNLDIINNTYDNIDAGLLIFKHYHDYWKSMGYTDDELVIRSLNSYNMGISGYNNYMSNGNNFDDWKYAKLVLDRMGR